MPVVFDPSNNERNPRGYVTSTLNQKAVGAYGSVQVNQFIKDAKNKKDSVDFIVISDSNGGTNSSGFTYSLEKGMLDAGALAYSTSLYCSTMSNASSLASNFVAGIEGLKIDPYCGRASGYSGGAGFAATGSSSGITAINNLWNNANYELCPGGTNYGLDWMYIASGSQQQTTFYLQIGADSPLDVKSAFKYRVGYVTFTSGSGSFSLISYVNGGSLLANTSVIQTNAGGASVGYSTATLDLAANASRSTAIRFGKYGSFYGATYGVTGPAGFLFESAYRQVKGFAVNLLSYYSGASTSTIAAGIVNSGDTIKTYLKEIRERQIDAGGTGRVVVFVNTGANDSTNIGDWATNANTIISAFKNKWDSLGYPQSDLAFLLTVSHPQADPDGMAAGRGAAKSGTTFGPSNQLSFIDLNEVSPYSYLNSNSYYDTVTNAHLKTTGYGAVGSLIIAALLK
jgi:hypothetical protein